MRIPTLVVVALMSCSAPKAPAERAPSPSQTGTATATATVGAKAPDGQLTQVSGAKIAFADVLHQHAQTVVVFYRGFY
jgi:uncharacterized protein YcfL